MSESGYWNGWSNFEEWAEINRHTIICKHCSNEIYPTSGNQRYCNREQSPSCDDDRFFDKLWDNGKHPLQVQKEIE